MQLPLGPIVFPGEQIHFTVAERYAGRTQCNELMSNWTTSQLDIYKSLCPPHTKNSHKIWQTSQGSQTGNSCNQAHYKLNTLRMVLLLEKPQSWAPTVILFSWFSCFSPVFLLMLLWGYWEQFCIMYFHIWISCNLSFLHLFRFKTHNLIIFYNFIPSIFLIFTFTFIMNFVWIPWCGIIGKWDCCHAWVV